MVLLLRKKGARRRFNSNFLSLIFYYSCLFAINKNLVCFAQNSFQAESNGIPETSGRLVNELLEMFVRSAPAVHSTSFNSDSDSVKTKFFDESNPGRFMLSDSQTSNRRRSADPTDVAESRQQEQLWSNLAKDVFNIFRPTTTPAPTTTTPAPTTTTELSFVKRIGQFVPELFKNPFKKDEVSTTTSTPFSFFSPQTFPTLPSLFPFSQTEAPKKNDNIFDRVSSLFESKSSNRPSEIDTGRHFDRFIVRENADTDNPIANLVGGKFNERGVEWNNGNLRFVNKQGSKLFGSEVAVHDRSVDIPVEQWFNFANSLMNDASRSRQ